MPSLRPRPRASSPPGRAPGLPARAARAAAAALAGAALLGSAGCSNGIAGGTRPDFDAARAWKDLEAQVAFGPRPAGSEALERTRRYLEAELSGAGLKPVREAFTADTPEGPIAMVNVYADLAARPTPDGAPAEWVVLAAHYETKRGIEGFVGANDGASGTAVLLELARVLAAGGPRRLAYRFLFVDGEEAVRRDWAGEDNTYGSRHHAAGLVAKGLAERVRAAIVLDMVGEKGVRLSRDALSDRRLVDIFFGAAEAAGLGAHVGGRLEEIKDDHLSFMAAGIPSVDLIDIQYEPWHKPSDTPDKCAPESLAAIGRIVLLGLPQVETGFLRSR
jgi:Peptidase family M28